MYVLCQKSKVKGQNIKISPQPQYNTETEGKIPKVYTVYRHHFSHQNMFGSPFYPQPQNSQCKYVDL